MQNLFVYGTLKKGFMFNFYMRGCVYLGEAKVEGYELFKHRKFPFIIKGNGVVYGEVYAVDDYNLKLIDCVEGVPYLFRRHKAKATMLNSDDNIVVPVFLYVLSDRSLIKESKKIESGIFTWEEVIRGV